MKQRILIRLVSTPGHLRDGIREQLDELDRLCLPEDTSYPKDGCYWWLAFTEDGDVVGFAGLKVLTKPNRGMAFLCRAGVLPRASGNGLQRRLIRARIRKARSLGLTQVITCASRCNYKSAANLLRSGMQFYKPATEFGVPNSLYFRLFL